VHPNFTSNFLYFSSLQQKQSVTQEGGDTSYFDF